MIDKKGEAGLIVVILIVLTCSSIPLPRSSFCAETDSAGSQMKTGKEPAVIPDSKLGGKWKGESDLIGTVNPLGIELTGEIDYRNSYRYSKEYDAVSGYWQTGAGLGMSPAYLEPTVEFEYMPWLATVLNVQYNGYYFFGDNGGLLSFSSPQQPFGDRERREREGTEETAFGRRLMLQPTLQFKMDTLIIRNQSDLAWYRFTGRGPYFLELEYDTLLKNDDHLFANRTQALEEISRSGDKVTLAGPFFELVHAEAADLTSKKIGLLFYSEQGPDLVYAGRTRYFGQLGYYLSDPNRGHELFFLVGLGGDFDLK